MNTKKTAFIRVISLLLVFMFLLPTSVSALETRASYYLDAYTAYIYPAGWGKIQVWFSVDGTGTMDEIGTLEIQIYESKDNENWYWVETFMYPDDEGMLGFNNFYHDGYVQYNGTIGRYYKAYVCVWAGKDGDGDTRYFWTTPKKATLFAG